MNNNFLEDDAKRGGMFSMMVKKIGTIEDWIRNHNSKYHSPQTPLYGITKLAATFSITGASSVYQDTGLSVSLPSAGVYKISCDVYGILSGNTGTYWGLLCQLYNSTTAAVILDSQRTIFTTTTKMYAEITCPVSYIVVVGAPSVIKLQAARYGDGTWTTSNIVESGNGHTVMMYEKIG